MKVQWISVLVSALGGFYAEAQPVEPSKTNVLWNSVTAYQGTRYFDPSNNCGIYRTPGDRQARTLSLAIQCSKEPHKLKPGFIQDRSAIKIEHEGETRRYLRRDLYGYRDCNGVEYHFFEGKPYELVNPGEPVPIYRMYEWVGKQRMTLYFFSGEDVEAIQPLTLDHLRREFSDEALFLERLYLLAENDFQLIRYRHAINRLRMSVPGI